MADGYRRWVGLLGRIRRTSIAISQEPLALTGLFATLVALLVSVCGAAVAAHDIPNDVTVQALVRPEGQRLRVLVRAPLQAMRDMDYPKPRGATNPDLLD